MDRFSPEARFILWKAATEQEGQGGRDAETEGEGFVRSGPSKCHQLFSLSICLSVAFCWLSHTCSPAFSSFLNSKS